MKRAILVTAAVLCAGGAFGADTFEVLGLGGAGGMYTPASCPTDPKLMLVSCDMSGSYRSLDGGKSWEMIDSAQLHSSLACKPMFAADRVFWVREGELRVSRDKGKTWTAVSGPWGGASVVRLASDLANAQAIYVGAGDAVYGSTDAGATWKKGPSGTGGVGGIAAAGTRVYAAVGSALWVSGDSGATWGQPNAQASGGRKILAAAAGAEGGKEIAFFVVQGAGILRSTDGGATWAKVLARGDGDVKADLVDVVMSANQVKAAYACDRTLVFRTGDGGAGWESCFRMDSAHGNVERSWVQTELHWGYYVSPLGLGVNAANPDVVLVSTQGDFYMSNNGGRSWRQLMNEVVGVRPGDPGIRYRSNGLEVTSVWDFLFDPFDENRLYIAYTDIGFARSVDRGRTWIWSGRGAEPWTNTFYKVVFDPAVRGRMYAAASNRHDIPHWNHVDGNKPGHSGGVVVSDDRGVTWRHSSQGLPAKPCTSVCIDPKSPQGRLTLYASVFEGGVFKSTDGGQSWVKKSSGLGNPGNLHALEVLVHPKSGDVYCSITAHREGSSFAVPGGLWKSTDGGETWTDITKALDLRWATYFTLHPTEPDTIYLSAATAPGFRQGGVYKTTDGGRAWTRILKDEDFAKRKSPGYVHAMNVRLSPADPDRVYVCSSHGLWFSADAGRTWKWFAQIPFGSAQNVAFDPKDPKTICVTTFGGGTWRGPATP